MSSTFPPPGRWISSPSKTGITKLAWKRDRNVPPGQPALGRFECVCGNVTSGVTYGGPDSTCGECGRSWDGHGWLVGEPPASPVAS